MASTKTVLRLADLAGRSEVPFAVEPDANERASHAEALDISGIRKLRFTGTLKPQGKRDWRLDGALGATVVQECVVTLNPVTTRIDEKITRVYLADMDEPIIGEVEMPEDESIDPLPETVDLVEVMMESLSLALPPFPRADDASLGEAIFSEPGVKPMTDEDARPFAGLQGLKDALEKKDKSGQ